MTTLKHSVQTSKAPAQEYKPTEHFGLLSRPDGPLIGQVRLPMGIVRVEIVLEETAHERRLDRHGQRHRRR